jgi:hypothetical protein
MSMLGGLSVGLLSTCLAAMAAPQHRASGAVPEVSEFERLKAEAEANLETDEAMNYMITATTAMEAASNSAHQTCSGKLPSGKIPAFELIFGVGKDGMPQQVVVQPVDGYSGCFAHAFATNKIGVPPKQPFYIYIDMASGK